MTDSYALIGQIAVGLLVLGGVVHTNRASKRASDKATAVSAKREAGEEWSDLVTQLRAEVERIRPRVEELEKHRDADALAIRRLSRRLDDYVRRYRAAVRYIIDLQRFISTHLPGGPNAPSPPADLLFDLDDPEREPSAQWPPPHKS